MLKLQAVDSVALLEKTITSSKMRGDDYIEVAYSNLTSTKLTSSQIDAFLHHFPGDTRLVSVLFRDHFTNAEHALNILKKNKFEEMLCLRAGKVYCANEAFLVTLIVNVHKVNNCRAQKLTKEFEKHISQAGALTICKNANNDPDLCQILNPALQRKTQAETGDVL